MYASCGWFFDDVAGLEASLVIRMGAHALDLLADARGKPPTRQVLDVLAEAKSNRPEAGTGADVFRQVSGDRVTVAHAVAGAALCDAVGAPRVDVGWEVALAPAKRKRGAHASAGVARATHLRTGAIAMTRYAAQAGPQGGTVATVGRQRLTIDDLDAETKGALVMAQLPSLLREGVDTRLAALAVDAARELPPDGETPEGVARRATLTQVLLGALEGTPSAANLRLAAELYDIVALPDTATERRVLEERVWTLCSRGRPSAPLRALAEKVGVAIVKTGA